MKDTILSRKDMYLTCAEPSEGDGVPLHAPPRSASRVRSVHGKHPSSPDRKALQLCHQVAETLEEVLAECGDSVLQELRVLDVEPAPDASRLLVTVAVEDWENTPVSPSRIHDHLVRAAGHLRSEVAGAITRRRAPVLIYRLASPGV